MKLTTPMQITAADSDSRTITGRIVAFNEHANASTGKVVFAKGSIQPNDVFLNLEHDNTRRIGKSIAMSVNDKEMTATFKIANTTAGTDALTEAMEGLRDGFSIELAVDNYEMQKDGTMKVLNGQLTAVALVTEPAVRSARVQEVAASEDSETETVTDTTNPNEGDKVENTTEQVTAPAVEPVAAPEVTAPVQASRPAYYTAPRSPIVNKVSYLEHYLKATILHDEDSRQYVKAADNTTSTAPGMVPTPQSTQVINALANADRGCIDGISRETLVAEGMTFELPRVTAVPSVDAIAENGAITDTSLSATFLSVSVQPFKGRAISTVELIDRSRPEYLTALLQNLEFAYAKETDEYALAAMQAAVTSVTAQAANSATGFLGYTSKAAANVYGASLGFARSLIVSPTQWGNIMGYNDNGTPLYNAAQPSNQAGNVRGDSLRGVVSPGLNLYVSRSFGNAGTTTADADSSMVVVNPDSYTWYESPRFTLRTNINSDGTIDILYYGYGALAAKVPNGAQFNNLP
jgi:phage head maturation protease